jgi:hypothetical protein
MDEMIGHLSATWPDDDDPQLDGIASRWTEAREELLAVADYLDEQARPLPATT